MDDLDHSLSFRLYAILDLIGASEEMRDRYREETIVSELVYNFVKDDTQFTLYIAGSRYEGTTTTGLDSDGDFLLCSSVPVVENTSDAAQTGLSLLMVTDGTTSPGYCKLQVVIDKVPIYHADTITVHTCVPGQNGRMCLQHMNPMNRITGKFGEMNGPAIRSTGDIGRIDHDLVMSVRYHNIPSFAKSWVTRVTQCNNLNQTQMHMLTEYGCFFVGKNHPSSKNGPIEWRLSFTLQERELMSSLNLTQHKCYILLNMIKKDIMNRRVLKSISSYHLKTCLLYTIERTPCEFWTRRNLLECTLLCTKLLLHWVKQRRCPNYFVPNENMFDGIQHRTLRQVGLS